MNKIAILDFGSQYTQLIARRLRELKVYSEIFPFHISLSDLKTFSPNGIILSGGPASVTDSKSPYRNIRELGTLSPLLGICYGMQLMAQDLGGQVRPSENREYGFTRINWRGSNFLNIKDQIAWMSHGDTVFKLPEGFEIVSETDSGAIASIYKKGFWGVQFHPEVTHTQSGDEIFKKFFHECNIMPDWSGHNIFDSLKEKVLKTVKPNEKVLCALSGGVDSSVAGVFLTKILGKENVFCLFVNNGLLRKNEFQEVLKMYENLDLNVNGIDASQSFLEKLKGITDPEEKRKIIGKTFIEVFEKHMPLGTSYLAQGTLYPDVIESLSIHGGHVTIKSHHNVGGLPEKMKLKLVEPFRELFKDEVRSLGRDLGLPAEMLQRHPFPGPGLSVRILGEVNLEKINVLQQCDAIFIEELKASNLYSKIWQAFCVLLPIQTVGVQGDERTYENAIALRAVTSVDGMTADWYPFEMDFLKKVSSRITNEVKKINRVVYDITSKPPGTIEWE